MRMGQFSRVQHDYGMSLGVVKPPDNYPGSIIPSELFDPALNLTEAQRQELAEMIRNLFDIYRGISDFYPGGQLST